VYFDHEDGRSTVFVEERNEYAALIVEKKKTREKEMMNPAT